VPGHTPGVGSVIRANTDATRAFVPQIDAALVVIGTDPPISGEELAVEEAAAQVGTLLFVLSKADRSTETERGEAVASRRVLADRLRTERTGAAGQRDRAAERRTSVQRLGRWRTRCGRSPIGRRRAGRHAARRGSERLRSGCGAISTSNAPPSRVRS
jgi:hypothetical protein